MKLKIKRVENPIQSFAQRSLAFLEKLEAGEPVKFEVVRFVETKRKSTWLAEHLDEFWQWRKDDD